MHFIEYTSLIFVYVCISCITGGYIYKKVHTVGGPDVLIPLFGGLFWPVFYIGYAIVCVIEFLVGLGNKLG